MSKNYTREEVYKAAGLSAPSGKSVYETFLENQQKESASIKAKMAQEPKAAISITPIKSSTAPLKSALFATPSVRPGATLPKAPPLAPIKNIAFSPISTTPSNMGAIKAQNAAIAPKAPAHPMAYASNTLPDANKKNILNQMFDSEEDWLQKAKSGNIGGAALNFVGGMYQGGQSFAMNTLNAADSLLTGNGLPEFKYNMGKADFDRESVDRRGGGQTIGEKLMEKNKVLGTAYGIANEMLTDPLELTPFGLANDIRLAKGMNQGSAAYAEAMRSGKMIPKVLPTAAESVKGIKQEYTKIPVVGENGKAKMQKVPVPQPEAKEAANIRATSDEIKNKSRILKTLEHGPQQMMSINMYHNSVNQKVLDFVKKVESLEDSNVASKLNQPLSAVTGKEVSDIYRLTGINVNGYIHNLNGSSVKHINKRHGVNGLHDDSMVFAEDIARMEHVLSSYDKVDILPLNERKSYSNAWFNSDSSPSIMVKYEKRLNGSYYIVEAVPDSKSKQLQVVSAYMDNKKRSTATGQHAAEAPPPMTSETRVAPTSFNTYNMPQAEKIIKSNQGNLSVKTAPRAPELLKPLARSDKPLQTAEDYIKSMKPQPQNSYMAETAPRAESLYERVKPSGSAPKASSGMHEELEGPKRTYGEIPQGESPLHERTLPQKTHKGKVRRFTRTILEGTTDESAIKTIEDEVIKGTYAYNPVSNKQLIDEAVRNVTAKGYDKALKNYINGANSGRAATSRDIAEGELLLRQAIEKKDIKAITELSASLSADLTEAGRTVQAARIFKKLTPEGKIVSTQRRVDKINKDLVDRYGDKAPKVELGDETFEKIAKAKNNKEMEEASAEALSELAKQLPADWQDKINAWRYLSMLGNAKTHIRNIVGNGLFWLPRKTRDLIATGIERTLPTTERTKAMLTAKDKGLIDIAKENFEFNKKNLQSGGHLGDGNDLRYHEDRTIFKTRWLEKLRKLNMGALEAEDLLFMKKAYVSKYAEFLKAKGYTADMLKRDGAEISLIKQQAEDYAQEQALRATFRDANDFSTFLNNIARQNANDKIHKKIGKMGVEAAFPFKKTPVNILRRGIDFSPMSLITGMNKLLRQVPAGKATPAEAIEKIAEGITGTGVVGLGYFLASQGLVSGKSDKTGKEGEFSKYQGEQQYALNIGDKSYTIDWAAPMALPFFIGVEIANGKGAKNSAANIFNALANMGDPLLNLSFVQGINNIIKHSYKGIGDIGTNLAMGYAGQFVPTLSGQIARTMDDTRRSTYAPSDSAYTKPVERFARQQMNKIPGLSRLNEPIIDVWGQEVKQPENLGMRAFQNFLSPGYLTDKSEKPVDTEIIRLYEQTGNDQVFPRKPPTDFSANSTLYYLAGEDVSEFQRIMGKRSQEEAAKLTKSTEYTKMSDDEKAKALNDIYQDAYDYAKAKHLQRNGGSMVDVLSDKHRESFKAVKRTGITDEQYYETYKAQSGVVSDKDASGNTIRYSESRNKKKVIDKANPHATMAQRRALYEAFGISESVWLE